MRNFLAYLAAHKYGAYTTSFLLMMLPVVPMYYAAQAGSVPGMVTFLAIFVSGNILALLIP
jgi:uncharacterized membrane-anchored protein YitT (DUF2179 family)